MTTEAIAALVALAVLGVIVFVAAFTVARLILRDRTIRSVRVGVYLERRRWDDDQEPPA